MEFRDESTYKILNAYRDKRHDKVITGLGVTGLVALVVGVLIDSTPVSVGGSSLCGISIIDEGIEYTKAYMEARLDHLANNRFTKIS